jgi:hypothetical protein
MRAIGRLLRLSIPMGALAALAMAVPAQAGPTDVAACTVSGLATTNGVKNVGGTGTFSFTSGAGTTTLNLSCVGSNGSAVDVQSLSADSAGSYNNEVCGTGTADGSNAAPTATSLGLPGTTNLTSLWTGVDFDYHISFVGGQGALVFTAPSAVSGGGPISIAPLDTPNPVTGVCTVRFEVNGALAGVLGPSVVNDGDLPHTNLIP